MPIFPRKPFWLIAIWIGLFAAFYLPAANADERILDFVSDVSINQDASADVTEKIVVNAEGQAIQHGIVRKLFTSWRDLNGGNHYINYDNIVVSRDGRNSSFHKVQHFDAVEIYIGSPSVILPPGRYTYVIQYHIANVILFHQTNDEFYWNITGNGWQFPIDQVTAKLSLPANIAIQKYSGYTGPLGAKGQDFSVQSSAANSIQFTTTAVLQPGDGLTVAIAFPTDFVQLPVVVEDPKVKREKFLIMELVLLMIGYYILVGCFMAREPAKGTIIPLFEPPLNVSPADMRYITKKRCDNQGFATAVVSMASKNFLKICENEGIDTFFRLIRNKEADSIKLSPEEDAIADNLFAEDNSIALVPSQWKAIKAAHDKFNSCLERQFNNVYVITNSIYLIPGLALGLLAWILMLMTVDDALMAVLVNLIAICLFVSVKMVYSPICGYFGYLHNVVYLPTIGEKVLNAVIFIVISTVALPVILFGVVMVIVMGVIISFPNFCFLVLIIASNMAAYYVFRIHTPAGRKVMDQIAGFQLFLSITEADRIARLNPPNKTPALFEKFLPYAMALDISKEWSDQFTSTLKEAGVGQDAYQPSWYQGGSWSSMSPGLFADSLTTNLTSAIADSSTSPSSGGGSSGGGGGGGGGGGW
jgi:uncharacterized membrane protein YgcG